MGEKNQSRDQQHLQGLLPISNIKKQHLQTDLVPFILYISRIIAVTLITDEHF